MSFIKKWLRRWLLKDAPRVLFVIDSEMASVSEDRLGEHMVELVKSSHWPFFIEKIRRMRDFHVQEMVLSTEREQIERLKGRIKMIDWLILLDKNINT